MTRAEWFSLPMKLRYRYWEETDYGRLYPSEALWDEILRALA